MSSVSSELCFSENGTLDLQASQNPPVTPDMAGLLDKMSNVELPIAELAR